MTQNQSTDLERDEGRGTRDEKNGRARLRRAETMANGTAIGSRETAAVAMEGKCFVHPPEVGGYKIKAG
jgi:ribosome assembly protein YihI (activator of Der GTPase)